MARSVPRTVEDPMDDMDPSDDLMSAAQVGFHRVPRTSLGRALLAARREFLASEGRFLGWEELEREIAERRGGVHAGDDE